jgi:hypothetical protein
MTEPSSIDIETAFEADLEARLEVAGDDLDAVRKVARWVIDRALEGFLPAARAVFDAVDDPPEEADSDDE